MTYLALTDHTTTINLSGDGNYLYSYMPSPGGTERVTETIEVGMGGSTAAEVLEGIRDVEQALRLTRQYDENYEGKQWYLQFQPNGASEVLESPVYGGRVEVNRNALRWQLENKQVSVGIVVERAGWWEGTSDVEVGLTNGNGTSVTGGINVFNCNDGSGISPNIRNNYVEISGLNGDMPARCKIEMTNMYNSSTRAYNIWVSRNAFSNASSFGHVIEGESASSGGSNAAGSYSGGYTRVFTWSGDAQTNIGWWALSASLLESCGGRWFKVFGALSNILDPVYVQVKLTFPSGTPLTVLGQDGEVLLDGVHKFAELGTIQLPPWLVDMSDLYPLDLSLYARKSGGGTLGIDFLYLMPAECFAVFKPKGYGLAYLAKLVYDGINGVVYSDGWSPSGKVAHYMRYGSEIELEPGITQRLYFEHDSTTGSADIDRKLIVRVWYRARYGTI